jgi:hypothetical protein
MPVYRPFDYIDDCARAVLHAARGEARKADAALHELRARWGGGEEGHAEIAIHTAQVQRLLGRNLRKLHAKAAEELQAAQNRRVGLLARMVHCRNALATGDSSAADLVSRFTDAGYLLFEGIAPLSRLRASGSLRDRGEGGEDDPRTVSG